MKVQVPVPHSLQRVVHNPLYDMHEPSADGPMTPSSGGGAGAGGFGAAWLPPVGQGGFAHGQGQGLMGIGGAAAGAAAGGAGGQAPGAALLAPPVLAPVGAGGPAAGGEGGGVDGGGGIGAAGAGNEAGLMDHLEDMLDAAVGGAVHGVGVHGGWVWSRERWKRRVAVCIGTSARGEGGGPRRDDV